MNTSNFLYENIRKKINSFLSDKEFHKIRKEISYINDNLVLDFRDYQINAMGYGIYAIRHGYHNLMFNMATGSGKTDIMAGLMLYMFNYYDVHNFLYTISKKAVVNQSKRALSKPGSKYLFKNHLVDKNGDTIIIRPCKNFPHFPQRNTIYICCTSIQTLRSRVFNPRENEVSIDSAASNPLVILADEAHHYNTDTRNGKTKSDKLDRSWENTLEIIRKHCKNNNNPCYQFDFTATLDLHTPRIRKKYAPIMAYRYTLSDFMNDGYSKNINVVHSTDHIKTKMKVAILTNQFRKLIARYELDNDNFKPVLMFKSPYKTDSTNNERTFKRLVRGLTVSKVQNFVNQEYKALQQNDNNPLLTNVFQWWHNFLKESSLTHNSQIIDELKDDFGNSNNIINLNSKKDFDKGKWKELDQLDKIGNLCRVIFEVKKIDEGWDVHNLFDIVRLNTKISSPNYSLKEAQLIGRGARYYYFRTKDREPIKGSHYKRCYDGASQRFTNKRMLETLVYFTIDKPKYNKQLAAALKQTNIIYNTDSSEIELSAKVTSAFKKSDVYKYGLIYSNTIKHRSKSKYKSLRDFNIRPSDPLFNVIYVHNTTSEDFKDINPNNEKDKLNWIYDRTFNLVNHKRLISDIMPSIPFYRFDIMSKRLPINSIKDFINNYLSGYHIRIRANYQINIKEILSAFKKVLTGIGKEIRHNFNKPVGTTRFVPQPVKNIIGNYQRMAQINTSHKISKQSILPKPMNLKASDLSKFRKKIQEIGDINYAMLSNQQLLKQHPWFTFNYEIGDGLERRFVSDISSIIKQIKQRIHPKHIYLFRNDEDYGQLSLHDIPRNNYQYPNLNVYMPDFVLYISHPKDCYAMYEFYLEPKGNGFITNGKTLDKKDAWKQKLLEFINPNNITIDNDKLKHSHPYKEHLGSINDISLYGIKFYEYQGSSTNWKAVRTELLNKL